MFDFLKTETASSTPQQIANSMRWLGWAGFWLQALLGFIPLLVVVTSVLFNPRQRQGGFSFGIFLAIACLVILIFSIYWCFRYTQLANKLVIRELRPAKSQVSRDLKLGLLANLSIMAIAVLIALSRVGELSFKMLTLPQGSTVITPNPTATMVTQGATIAPSTIIAIQAMVNAIAAGLVGAIVAIVLLYQLGQNRND
ncbi:DUF3611 family protein [Chlorogloeopsis fritschii PCC 9212]|uniref:DUF3611 family protein n=1 Tax=Chlorogloeopsis fritschii PCC 6912 TaxID=211165 RepID=A0A3S0Y320_CHLFR|nr:DUF3611 family protein [Chlorogloeopsis fritschii]RUR84208.1 hypothetical protein PCC6912_18020 [Chlorogloeopsis fritschii PCC 6912]